MSKNNGGHVVGNPRGSSPAKPITGEVNLTVKPVKGPPKKPPKKKK